MGWSLTAKFPALEAPAEPRQSCSTVSERAANNDSEVSDATLLCNIRTENRDALTTLFRRYALLVRAVAYRILRDEAEADDLLQDIFLFIQCNCSAFDPAKGSGRSWIVHLAYQRAIDRRRYLNTRHFYTSIGIDNSVRDLPDPRATVARNDEALEASLAKDDLEKALAALSGDQRDTLRLYFFEGYTLNEIATKLSQSLGNVRNHYYRGLEKLRNQVFSRKLRGRRGI